MKKIAIILSFIFVTLAAYYLIINFIIVNRISNSCAYFEKFEIDKPIGTVYYAVPDTRYFIDYTTKNTVIKTGFLSSKIKIDTIKAVDMVQKINTN